MYASVADLMFGSVPVPATIDTWLQAADDEIDSKIGHIYITPVSFPATSEARPGMLRLKRIAAMLTTGRAIMSIDAGSEEDAVHQYAMYLLREAQDGISELASGDVALPGVQLLSPASTTSAPQISNVDATSAVEDFYGNFVAPDVYQEDPYWSYRNGGR